MSLNFYSFSQPTLTYEINSKKIAFYQNDSLRITSSERCQYDKNQKYCKNFDFLTKVSIKKLGKIPEGSPNPGSLICQDQVGGKSVIGYNTESSQNSFCELKNKVYIDNGSLTYHAYKNDGFSNPKRKINP